MPLRGRAVLQAMTLNHSIRKSAKGSESAGGKPLAGAWVRGLSPIESQGGCLSRQLFDLQLKQLWRGRSLCCSDDWVLRLMSQFRSHKCIASSLPSCGWGPPQSPRIDFEDVVSHSMFAIYQTKLHARIFLWRFSVLAAVPCAASEYLLDHQVVHRQRLPHHFQPSAFFDADRVHDDKGARRHLPFIEDISPTPLVASGAPCEA